MIEAKVKAFYVKNFDYMTVYGGVDLTDYNNDVKAYTRKMQVFRTDTNEIIATSLFGKDDYKVQRFVQEENFPASPYLNDLPIKAVLTITDVNGVESIAEDSVEFVSLDSSRTSGADIGIPRRSTFDGDSFYSVIDQTQYPFIGRGKSDFLRYAVVQRTATTLSETSKIQYIKEFPIGTDEIEFTYSNEFIVSVPFLWIDKVTSQLYEFVDAGYVNMNQDIDPYYNPGGIYIGAPGGNPLSDEDALPDLSVLLPLPPVYSASSDLLRPHVLTFKLPGTGQSEDPLTGFPIPSNGGEVVTMPCRFVSGAGKGGVKAFKNQQNEDVLKKGRIRVDVGSKMPPLFTNVVVKEGETVHFEGPALEVYSGGHLTGWRIDV